MLINNNKIGCGEPDFGLCGYVFVYAIQEVYSHLIIALSLPLIILFSPLQSSQVWTFGRRNAKHLSVSTTISETELLVSLDDFTYD